jgi:hypothetical protein
MGVKKSVSPMTRQ